MFKKFKVFLIIVLLGICLGLWFGYNLGRGEAMLSNPFTETSVGDKILDGVDDGIDKLKENL